MVCGLAWRRWWGPGWGQIWGVYEVMVGFVVVVLNGFKGHHGMEVTVDSESGFLVWLCWLSGTNGHLHSLMPAFDMGIKTWSTAQNDCLVSLGCSLVLEDG